MGVGFAGLYSIIVALKPVAADLGASRGGVSLAYAVLFTGFGFGGIIMGWWSDRIGTMWPVLAGSVAIAAGLLLAAQATSLWQIVLAFGLLVGFLGMSAIMVPLVANITHWFDRRRGIATSIVISGSYLAGTMWPPLLQIGVEEIGWRETWTRVGIGCFLVMAPLSLLLRPRLALPSTAGQDGRRRRRALGFTPTSMQCLLCTAGLGCCIAMATPQAHIVAHATDLGHPAARGAEMLSLVFFGGLVSRVVYGWISDRIGGLRTLVIGSLGQAVTIALFIPVEGLVELYVVCALFGLSQGGNRPVVRAHRAALLPRRRGRVAARLDHALHDARDGLRRVARRDPVRSYRHVRDGILRCHRVQRGQPPHRGPVPAEITDPGLCMIRRGGA